MPDISLRPVTSDDDSLLQAVFRTSHPEYEMLPLPEEQKDFLIKMQFQLQSTDYRGRYPESRHDIIELEGKPVGRLWVASLEDRINVLDVGLLPEARNQGIGTFVMDRLKAEAGKTSKAVTTVVAKFNPGSLRWHLRMGFRTIREEEFHHFMEWRAPENS